LSRHNWVFALTAKVAVAKETEKRKDQRGRGYAKGEGMLGLKPVGFENFHGSNDTARTL